MPTQAYPWLRPSSRLANQLAGLSPPLATSTIKHTYIKQQATLPDWHDILIQTVMHLTVGIAWHCSVIPLVELF